VFKRLCIDIEDTGLVLGGSVEWFLDSDATPYYVGVCHHEHVFEYGPHAMLDHLADTVIVHSGYAVEEYAGTDED
jgi:hypothetical protein